MKKKFLVRFTAAMGIALCSLSLLFVAPQTNIKAQAASGGGTTVSPQADIITWVYAEWDNKLWKRQWNGTTATWLTDWIFVRDL